LGDIISNWSVEGYVDQGAGFMVSVRGGRDEIHADLRVAVRSPGLSKLPA